MIATTDSLPLEVGQLGNFEARMLRNLRAAVEDWDEVCSALGPWESKHLAREGAGVSSEQHLRWVTELIAWGRLLRQMTGRAEFPDRALAERVEARLRHLQDKFAVWHQNMTPAEEERILRTAFA